ncbi:MAG: hypothetical protein H0W67_06655, partial [Gemmatimonadales bacterium]|nr:hypothetical protein [Gemmatimonadales bacterium]
MRVITRCALAAVLALNACSDNPDVTAPDPGSGTGGAVYVQTNDSSKNEVIAYRRAADGTLNLLGA